MACTFQATTSGKLAPLISHRDEDMDINNMITTAVTDAASEILGKECHRKKPWSPEVFSTSVMRKEI